jgi:hypothetical protein
MLSISVGPARSKVLVDGEDVGSTPYAGDFTCRLGDPVQIQVIGPSGSVKQFKRTCVKDIIAIRNENE